MLRVVQHNFIALTCGAQWLSGIPGQNTSLRLTTFFSDFTYGYKGSCFSWQESEGLAFNEANQFFQRERGLFFPVA